MSIRSAERSLAAVYPYKDRDSFQMQLDKLLLLLHLGGGGGGGILFFLWLR